MILFKIGFIVVVEIIIVVQLMNGYKLLVVNVNVGIEMKYIILLFYFDVFDFENLMQYDLMNIMKLVDLLVIRYC